MNVPLDGILWRGVTASIDLHSYNCLSLIIAPCRVPHMSASILLTLDSTAVTAQDNDTDECISPYPSLYSDTDPFPRCLQSGSISSSLAMGEQFPGNLHPPRCRLYHFTIHFHSVAHVLPSLRSPPLQRHPPCPCLDPTQEAMPPLAYPMRSKICIPWASQWST